MRAHDGRKLNLRIGRTVYLMDAYTADTDYNIAYVVRSYTGHIDPDDGRIIDTVTIEYPAWLGGGTTTVSSLSVTTVKAG